MGIVDTRPFANVIGATDVAGADEKARELVLIDPPVIKEPLATVEIVSELAAILDVINEPYELLI